MRYFMADHKMTSLDGKRSRTGQELACHFVGHGEKPEKSLCFPCRRIRLIRLRFPLGKDLKTCQGSPWLMKSRC